jgi:hypothetical protein
MKCCRAIACPVVWLVVVVSEAKNKTKTKNEPIPVNVRVPSSSPYLSYRPRIVIRVRS